MKKYILTGCIAAFAMSSSILNAMTEEQKQYIKLYGMIVAEQSGIKQQLDFNNEEFEVFLEGFKARFKGEELPKDVMVIGQKMGEYLEGRATENMNKALEKAKAASADFWKKIKEDKNIQKAESGLAYQIHTQGKEMAKPESSVKIKYTGKLIDGTVFDTSERSEDGTATFLVSQVIPGFAEGLLKVGKGGKATLYIPSELGYGDQPNERIPAGSTLIFDIEVIDVINDAADAKK